MDVLTVFALAVALAMDAFAVAIAVSVELGRFSGRQGFRLSFHFGLFQALMPLLGWVAGRTIEEEIRDWDHWLAFALLSLVGIRAIIESFSRGVQGLKRDPTRGLTLVVLSTAVSIDALAVGLSFSFLQVSLWFPVLVIGLVASAMTLLGLQLGARLGGLFGRHMQRVGGLVLILIGARVLVEHLWG